MSPIIGPKEKKANFSTRPKHETRVYHPRFIYVDVSLAQYIIQLTHLCKLESQCFSGSVSVALPTMSKDRLVKSVKKFTDVQYKLFTARYGQQLIDIFEFPVKLVLSPFTIAIDVVGSAQRGFGVPELISKLSYASIFVSSCKAPTFIVWRFCCVCKV